MCVTLYEKDRETNGTHRRKRKHAAIYIYIETVTTTAPAQAKAVEGMEKNCIAHNLKEHKRHF